MAHPSTNAVENRVAACESAARSVPATFDVAASPAAIRVRDDLVRRGILGAGLVRVPPEYYSWPLIRRASCLHCRPEQLCKVVVMRNESPGAVDGAPVPHVWSSRYLAIVVQYVAKLDVNALEKWLRNRADPAVRSGIRLTMAEDAPARTGYSFNAVCPFGLPAPMPLIVTKPIAALPAPATVFLGGGEVDVKCRMFVSQLLNPELTAPCPPPVVVDCAVPRGMEEGDEE